MIIHRSFGLELFNIPLCLAIRQAWQRPHMPKRGRRKEFKQVLGKCSVSGSRMKSFVRNTLVYQSTLPLHRLKLPIPRLRRQDTECQAEGWTRAWRGMTFGHEFNQKLEGVKLPNNLPNSTFGRVYPIPWGYINTTYPRTPIHITYHRKIIKWYYPRTFTPAFKISGLETVWHCRGWEWGLGYI